MKLVPTLEGGLRLDAESPVDVRFLQAIVHDAASHDLARNLGGLMTDETLAQDWEDFVIPDLQDGFDHQIDHVSRALEAALAAPGDATATLWIKPADAPAWYGALNQARLALEEIHGLSRLERSDLAGANPALLSAVFRCRFYQEFQERLLEHVMER